MDAIRETCRTTRTRRWVTIAGAVATASVFSRRLLREWGATKGECATPLPGDELIPEPATTVTRAVTIAASATTVWRWLIQIGQDRGGMYSYDWLENLIGLRIHSTEWINPEWQTLSAGDEIRLVRPGWLGLRDGHVLRVAQLDAPRTLVLYDSTFTSIWSFHIRPLGTNRCRLVSRSRAPRAAGPLAVIGEALDPITFVMTRGMLLGIKRRAEGLAPTTKENLKCAQSCGSTRSASMMSSWSAEKGQTSAS